ncbi:hypothetical protein MTR67_042935 [Solanum verrucosum]|uniref:Gag-pol polyprotein n=1 Tax=Solanum verrucosum TaxID=315347 RepID=A0AAF0ZU72_SOLVR|nr:hypothetical protein MTR67_042935 [Solanum verrucosum]
MHFRNDASKKSLVRRNLNVEREDPQDLVDLLAKQVTHVEFRDVFQVLVQVIMVQTNKEVVAPVNQYMGTVVTKVPDFTRTNPLKFHGMQMEEDPQEFIGEI